MGSVFRVATVSMLPHVEFERNDHREDAPHFISGHGYLRSFMLSACDSGYALSLIFCYTCHKKIVTKCNRHSVSYLKNVLAYSACTVRYDSYDMTHMTLMRRSDSFVCCLLPEALFLHSLFPYSFNFESITFHNLHRIVF